MVAKNHCFTVKTPSATLDFSRNKQQNESSAARESTTKAVFDKSRVFIEDFHPSEDDSSNGMVQSLIYFSCRGGTGPSLVSNSCGYNVSYIGEDNEKDNFTDSTGSIRSSDSWETSFSTKKSRLSTIYSCDEQTDHDDDDDDDDDNHLLIHGRPHERCKLTTGSTLHNDNGNWDEDDVMTDMSDVFANLPHVESSDVFDDLSSLLDHAGFRNYSVAQPNDDHRVSGSSNSCQHHTRQASRKEQMDQNKKRQNIIFRDDEYAHLKSKRRLVGDGKWNKGVSGEKNPLNVAISSILSLFACA